MAEKDPYLITRSQPDPNYPYDYWGEEYISSDRQKALQSIQITKSSIVVLLNRIHKFTSRTFHVLIRQLIPGAKTDKSNLFTMIKEHRNQYMIISSQRKRQSCSIDTSFLLQPNQDGAARSDHHYHPQLKQDLETQLAKVNAIKHNSQKELWMYFDCGVSRSVITETSPIRKRLHGVTPAYGSCSIGDGTPLQYIEKG
jgi:hypothetical protein